jgi:hypothetical protein
LSLRGPAPEVMEPEVQVYRWPLKRLDLELVMRLRKLAHQRRVAEGVLVSEALRRFLEAEERAVSQ